MVSTLCRYTVFFRAALELQVFFPWQPIGSNCVCETGPSRREVAREVQEEMPVWRESAFPTYLQSAVDDFCAAWDNAYEVRPGHPSICVLCTLPITAAVEVFATSLWTVLCAELSGCVVGWTETRVVVEVLSSPCSHCFRRSTSSSSPWGVTSRATSAGGSLFPRTTLSGRP
jgi:hypothetical protein